jgi:hypothetical protein
MTVARRISTLEGELDPTQRVMAWLAEAHTYDSFEGYLTATAAGDRSGMPMNRLPSEAETAVRRQRHGTARDRDAAVRQAIREVVMRVHLALRIVDVTDSVIRREELVLALLTAHVSLSLAYEGHVDRAGLPLVEERDLLLGRVAELLAQEEARKAVEARYLGGLTSLFPATVRRWQALLNQAQMAAVMALRLVELDGGEPIDEERQLVPDPARIEACVSNLVEVARVKTLDDMGEWDAAMIRLRRWLGTQPKCES